MQYLIKSNFLQSFYILPESSDVDSITITDEETNDSLGIGFTTLTMGYYTRIRGIITGLVYGHRYIIKVFDSSANLIYYDKAVCIDPAQGFSTATVYDNPDTYKVYE